MKSKKSWVWLRPIAIWVGLMVIPTIFSARPMIAAGRVLAHGEEVEGEVKQLLPYYHQEIIIEYRHGGATYTQGFFDPEDMGLPSFGLLAVGDKIPVMINPAFPAAGIPGNARRLLTIEIKDYSFFAVCFAIVVCFIEVKMRAFHKGSEGSWVPAEKRRQ